MTQVKRKMKRTPFRLMRACIITTAIVLGAVLLYELDAFHEKRQKRLQPKDVVSPEKLLLTQEKQKLRGAAAVPDNKVAEEEQPAAAGAAAEEEDKEENPLGAHKKFAVLLGGLTGTEESHRIMIETREDWSPVGVAHFHKLVEAHFYDQCRFFRALPKFVVQFGIAATPAVQQEWKTTVIQDDPVKQSNERGTISFATSGAHTRTTQLFINLADNKQLDAQGFSPIARVLEDGMEWIDRINAEHREKPDQGKIQQQGNEYLQKEFPDLSYIVSISALQQDTDDNEEFADVTTDEQKAAKAKDEQ